MNEREFWRDVREPPPGGLPRLVAAIERRRRHRVAFGPRRAWLAAAAVLLVTVAIATTWRTHTHAALTARAIEAALARDRQRVVVENGAAIELPSTRADVRIFAIASLPPAP